MLCDACKDNEHALHERRQRGRYKDETPNLKKEDKVQDNTIVPGRSCVCEGDCAFTKIKIIHELTEPIVIPAPKGFLRNGR